MWIIHSIMAVVGILILLFGYVAGDLYKDGPSGIINFLAIKFGCLIGGGFFFWYGMYQLGWRLVHI